MKTAPFLLAALLLVPALPVAAAQADLHLPCKPITIRTDPPHIFLDPKGCAAYARDTATWLADAILCHWLYVTC